MKISNKSICFISRIFILLTFLTKIMKVLCVLITVLVVLSSAQDADKAGSQLAKCGNKIAEKVYFLCGPFLERDEVLDVS